jgi:hypothetical protein
VPTQAFGKRQSKTPGPAPRPAAPIMPSPVEPAPPRAPSFWRRYSKVMWPVVAAMYAAHLVFRVMSPSFNSPQSQAQLATMTAAENMPAWVKIYPGAKDIEIRPNTVGNLHAWHMTYTVQPSPDQVLAFYQQVADNNGFSADESTLGKVLHMYRQAGTDDDFSVDASPGFSGTDVIYEPRSFDPPTPPKGG